MVVRFVVGYSEQNNDAEESALEDEMATYKDIIRVNVLDSYDQLPHKTLRMFADASSKVDAHFYFKVDDDIAVNLEAMHDYLKELRGQPNLYMGCMKSGPVLTDANLKWYEPLSWRFGDPVGEVRLLCMWIDVLDTVQTTSHHQHHHHHRLAAGWQGQLHAACRRSDIRSVSANRALCVAKLWHPAALCK